jgi:predicted transposase/invertase (TIGR01784 family)
MKTFFKRSRSDRELKQLFRESAAEGKPLSVMDDRVFKAMLTADTDDSREALRSLLSACIRREIAYVQVTNNDIVIDHLDAKAVRLDVNVTFNDGESANLEMQKRSSDDNLKDRAAIHAAMLHALQSRKGKSYRDFKRVYQIFFLNCELYPDSNKLPRRYSYCEEEEHDRLTDMTEIIFYEMPKLEKKMKAILNGTMDMDSLPEDEKWCIYMKYRHEERAAEQIEQLYRKEEGIMRAERAVNRISRDYLKAVREMNIRKNEMDRAQRIQDLEKAALTKGLAEGRTKGLAEGHTQGLAEGRAEGLEEGKLEIARKMKEMGLSFEQINAITGLSFETIKRL